MQKSTGFQQTGFYVVGKMALTLPCMILKNGPTYFNNLPVFTLQDFQNMFGHFSILCKKGLNGLNFFCSQVSLSELHNAFINI